MMHHHHLTPFLNLKNYKTYVTKNVNNVNMANGGSVISGLGNMMSISLQYIMSPSDMNVMKQNWVFYELHSLFFNITVTNTVNMTKQTRTVTSTNTLIESVHDSAVEPRFFLWWDCRNLGTNPMDPTLDNKTLKIPNVKQLRIDGKPVNFQWHRSAGTKYTYPQLTSALTNGTAISTLLTPMQPNQIPGNIYICWPEYADYTSAATIALGAAAFEVDIVGGAIFYCTENQQYLLG
jgi:uncharacterized protein YcfL